MMWKLLHYNSVYIGGILGLYWDMEHKVDTTI